MLLCNPSGGALHAGDLIGAQLLEVDGTSLEALGDARFRDHELIDEMFSGPIGDPRPWTILPPGEDTPITFDATPCPSGVRLHGEARKEESEWLGQVASAYAERRPSP